MKGHTDSGRTYHRHHAEYLQLLKPCWADRIFNAEGALSGSFAFHKNE